MSVGIRLFLCAIAEVWEWIGNFISLIMMDVITHPCLDLSENMLMKVVQVGLVSPKFTHGVNGYLTGSEAIIRLSPCHSNNPEWFGLGNDIYSLPYQNHRQIKLKHSEIIRISCRTSYQICLKFYYLLFWIYIVYPSGFILFVDTYSLLSFVCNRDNYNNNPS